MKGFRPVVWVTLAVWLAVAGSAIAGNAVDDGKLRYVSRTDYSNAVSWARQVWDAGDVRLHPANDPFVKPREGNETLTLKVVDVRVVDPAMAGKFRPKCCKTATGVVYSQVIFNCWWFGPPGTCKNPRAQTLSTANENIVGAHEFGHALALSHLGCADLMDPQPFNNNCGKPNTPQAADKAAYHERWDP